MNAGSDQCVYSTDERSVRRLRLIFWFTSIPLSIAILYIARTYLYVFLLFSITLPAIVVLNGFRTVIGARVCRDRLEISTPFIKQIFSWDEVKVKRYHWIFMRTDIYVSGKIWPFMMLNKRRVLEALEDVI
jgi:hypothetical protein